MKTKTLFAAIFAAIALLASPALARKHDSTKPGKYKDWNDELIDRLRIKQTFALADYQKLLLVPADIEDAKLPEKDDDDDDDYKEVMGVARMTRSLIRAGMEKELDEDDIEIDEADADEAEGLDGTLVLQVKLVELDPGSRGARFFVGFGAGGAESHISAELIDSKSGEVLLTLDHARRAALGAAGGSDEDLLSRAMREVGEDIGEMLTKF